MIAYHLQKNGKVDKDSSILVSCSQVYIAVNH